MVGVQYGPDLVWHEWCHGAELDLSSWCVWLCYLSQIVAIQFLVKMDILWIGLSVMWVASALIYVAYVHTTPGYWYVGGRSFLYGREWFGRLGSYTLGLEVYLLGSALLRFVRSTHHLQTWLKKYESSQWYWNSFAGLVSGSCPRIKEHSKKGLWWCLVLQVHWRELQL